jgi:hypothetical protein
MTQFDVGAYWNALSDKDQEAVYQLAYWSGAAKPGDVIIGHGDLPPQAQEELIYWNSAIPMFIEAAGNTWKNRNPIALAACLEIASAMGEYYRRQCAIPEDDRSVQ